VARMAPIRVLKKAPESEGNKTLAFLSLLAPALPQVPVIEQALETATRMLGSDTSRGYCLEMICADC